VVEGARVSCGGELELVSGRWRFALVVRRDVDMVLVDVGDGVGKG
jgi:hypothetical protein